jgi:dihydrofolate reductase
MTMGCVLIMGRKTYESIPVPLKGRTIIVMTRRPRIESAFVPDEFARDLDHALEIAKGYDRPVWIAGGGEVYRQALRAEVVDFIDMTVVPKVEQPPTPDDVFFPLGEVASGYRLEQRSRNERDDRLRHKLYVRK